METAHQAIGPVLAHESQGPKLERPHIDFDDSTEEWNVFTILIPSHMTRS